MKFFFPSRCYNGGQQHRFEKRMTTHRLPPRGPTMTPGGGLDSGTWEAEVRQTYHGDVCLWCGKVVNEQKAKA